MSKVYFFSIFTYFGTEVAIDKNDKHLIHTVAGHDSDCSYHRVFAYTYDDAPDIIFVAPSDEFSGVPLAEGKPLNRINAFRATICEDTSDFGFKYLVTGNFMCALQIEGSPISQPIVINRPSVQAWEQFKLSPADNIPSGVRLEAENLGALIGPEMDTDRLVEGLEDLSLSFDTIAAYFQLISPDQIDSLCAKLIHQPHALQKLVALYAQPPLPDTSKPDIWLEHGLLRLSRWLERGRSLSPSPEHLGEDFDVLDRSDWPTAPTILGQICTIRARRAVVPRKKFAVVCTARNEGVYLIDWIAYHKAIGFEHIFLYTNNNDDESDILLDILSREGIISLFRNKVGVGRLAQYKAYGHAHQILPDVLDYKWTAVIDLDEYVRFDSSRYQSLEHYIEWQDEYDPDCIQLPWITHSPNRNAVFEDRPIIDRFPNAVSSQIIQDINWTHLNCKSIFRINKFLHNKFHFPRDIEPRRFTWEDRIYYPGAELYRESSYHKSVNPNAWVDHHYFKSVEEYLIRKSSNAGGTPLQMGQNPGLLKTHNLAALISYFYGASVKNTIDSQTSRAAKDLSASIRSLPGVSDAHQGCVSAYQRRASALRSALAQDERFQTPDTPENTVFNILTRNAP